MSSDRSASFDRPVMLVTGASRGIGAATARMAAARGWDVVVNYANNSGAADAVVAECEAAGARTTAVQADVGDEAQVLALFAAVAEFGPLACLVNNAGILHPQSPLAEFSVERLAEVTRVNVIGATLCVREAVRVMSTERGGSGGTIVNVSSAAAYLGSPNEYIDYAATKGALDTLTVGLAKEVARQGIRVNAVRPGLIETDIHASGGMPDRVERLAHLIPMGRGGRPDEVAETILFLASDASSYVTGALLDVSGGR